MLETVMLKKSVIIYVLNIESSTADGGYVVLLV